jgi:steroid 5-alpha reductase family enzyme
MIEVLVSISHLFGGMTPAWTVYTICAIYIFTVVTVIWVIGIFQGNHSMMDGYYGFGYASVGWIAYIFSVTASPQAAVILLMVSLHGVRLGYYLSKRWAGYRKTSGGDKRYLGFVTQLRPGYWWKSFFMVMQPQTIVIMLISFPSIFGIMEAGPAHPFGVLEFAGMLVFGVGLYYEWAADAQLEAFKADANNKGRYLETGVWALTRHPNYFGNTVVWWGIYIMALAANMHLWWTVVGPLMDTVMLTKILGTAFQDKFMGSRPEYAALMQRRSGFLPRLRK